MHTQDRRIHSEALELDVRIDADRLRFFHGYAAIPYADELIARLDAASTELEAILSARACVATASVVHGCVVPRLRESKRG